MTKKLIFCFMTLAMLSGVVGGTLGSQLVQAKTKARKVIQAQEFRLADAKGIVRASIDLTAQGDLYVALYDAKGKTTDSVVVTPALIKASRKTAATLHKLGRLFSGSFMSK